MSKQAMAARILDLAERLLTGRSRRGAGRDADAGKGAT
jgi:hypothetical protein